MDIIIFNGVEMIYNSKTQLQEFKIPFKPSMFKIMRLRPKWIIIHHTGELDVDPQAKIDNSKFQLPLINNNALEKKTGDVNYHYILERIGEDFIATVARPRFFLCDFEDIHDDINQRAIHIALLGNFTYQIPVKRLYEVLAYRLLNPLLKEYALNTSRVKLHNEVSMTENLECPGVFVEPMIIQSMIRKFVIK
jgi:hypothetical protein